MRDKHDESDEMIDRIVAELRTLPPVPADAAARVLARVDAARRGGPSAGASDDDDVIFFPTSTEEMRVPAAQTVPGSAASSAGSRPAHGLRRRFVVSLPAAIGYAMAATLAGFLIRGAVPRPSETAPVAVAPKAESSGTSMRVAPVAVSTRALEERPLAWQFILDAPRARSVALVGDFNAWDATATPLSRDSATGVWSALVPVHPGRHVYAFLVDGKTWTLDPNAPRVRDADYGTEQSVTIVGVR